MAEITNLMRKLADRLFSDGDHQSAFLESLVAPKLPTQNAVIWTQPELRDQHDIPTESAPDWVPPAINYLPPGFQAGKTDAFANGAIYPVDVSSIHTASAMLSVEAQRILDVCAAPGGKTLFASTLLNPDFLLSNEIIGKRLGILRHNLKKSGRPNLFTQRIEPVELAESAPASFDLVIVDAPCSGQSLLAKGIDNPGCFHPNIVKGNARRQLRILAQSSACVAPGGHLFYSTCTFADRENEGVITKFLAKNPGFTTVPVPHLEETARSTLSPEATYRIYPHRKMGAGGFVCLMKRKGELQDLPELPDPFHQFPVA